MGWDDLFGRKSSEPPAPRVERLSRRQPPVDEIAEADAETRRMMEEAGAEMRRAFSSQERAESRPKPDEAKTKLVDVEPKSAPSPHREYNSIGELDPATPTRRFAARLNLLVALLVIVMIALFWLGARDG